MNNEKRKFSLRQKNKMSRRIEDKMNESEYLRAVVAIRNEQQENCIPYLKIIEDCWEMIFEFLTITDIINLSQTCKQMLEMCGYYIRTYFPEIGFIMYENGIVASYPRHIPIREEFYKYITVLEINRITLDSEKTISFFKKNGKKFQSLKTLKLTNTHINNKEIKELMPILKIIENLELRCFYSPEITFTQIANYCPQLKNLRMRGCLNDESIFSDRHLYPNLEHLSFTQYTTFAGEMPELECFLNRHTTLKHFECDWVCLWENREAFMGTALQLDELTIHFSINRLNISLDKFFGILIQLYHEGCYKWLNLTFDLFFHQTYTNTIYKYFPGLTQLITVKKLILFNFSSILINTSFISHLPELEEIQLDMINIKDIETLFTEGKNLKTIKINHIFEKHNINTIDIDLTELNDKRKNSADARRVSLYIPENFYLRLKEKMININLSHIKIKRTQ